MSTVECRRRRATSRSTRSPVAEVADVEDVEIDAELEAVDDDDHDDDVVVDLFARLRAEAVTIEPDDDAELDDSNLAEADRDEAMDVMEAMEATEVEVLEVGEAVSGDDIESTRSVEPTPFEQRDADLTPIIVGCCAQTQAGARRRAERGARGAAAQRAGA